jgi:hypothetical protein
MNLLYRVLNCSILGKKFLTLKDVKKSKMQRAFPQPITFLL